MKAIEEAKRIHDEFVRRADDSYWVSVPASVLEGLIAKAELAGAVTPGPSARQIIRERVARLTGE